MSLRKQIIDIQKKVVKRIKADIQGSFSKNPPELERYYQDYEQEFKGKKIISTKNELLEAILHSDIVYNGDYHTCKQSQRTPIRILREILPTTNKVILALEMLHIEDQEIFNAFYKGRLKEKTFLKKINYKEKWGFPWKPYADLINFARENRLKMVGINVKGPGGDDDLYVRDQEAARVIVETTKNYPDHLIFVFTGDLHIAQKHLPLLVKKSLKNQRFKRKDLIIFQNSDQIYWYLASNGYEHNVDVVRLSPNKYCVINTTPLLKYQSYLNWLDNTEELSSISPDLDWHHGTTGIDYHDNVLELIHIIAGFLGIDNPGLDNFSVYTSGNIDFLEHLKEDKVYTKAEIKTIASQILKNESYFINKTNIIYLANLSINHAAEEAAHFINIVCAGYKDEPQDLKSDFYYRIMREALAYLGSKIVNHKRKCYMLKDFKELIREMKNKNLNEKEAELLTIARFVLQHKRMEKGYIRYGIIRKKFAKIYEQDVDIHLGITHSLGYMLGNKLFSAMMTNRISKEMIRELYCHPFEEEDSAFLTYIDLIERLKKTKDIGLSRRESL